MNRGMTDVFFPGWEVVRQLGEGSFGGVYEIMRILPDGTVERCALKKLTVPKDYSEIEELRSLQYDNESITAHFHDQMQDLVREYSIMQKLGSNPNVVHCYDMKTIQHRDGIGWDIYIRMELLTPLKQAADMDYNETEVIRLAVDMCGALHSCHKNRIIHRDIKPENILVSPEGKYKLGDFGIAKITEKTATGTLTGTYSYMAPEIFHHQRYGVSADIYSLGLVMYWMMNEHTLPFLPYYPTIPTAGQRQEAQERRFNGEPLPAPLHGSRWLKKIVMKACAFDPQKRYHSVQELIADLEKEKQEKRDSSDEPSQEKNINSQKILLVSVAVTASMLVLLIAFFAVSLFRSDSQPTVEAHPEPSSTLSNRTSEQLGEVSNQIHMVKNLSAEGGYFWGQAWTKREEIQKIIFTNKKISGTYSWDISEAGDESIIACINDGVLYVISDGQIKLHPDSSNLFAGFESIDEIAFNGIVDTSSVENMSQMFADCYNLTELDLSDWKTANVMDMSGMFASCVNLRQLDVSRWDTSSVETMASMFFACHNLTQLNMSQWDTSNVKNMNSMFFNCSSLTTLDVSEWNTGNVFYMNRMFSMCSSLVELDVSKWNTGDVSYMEDMFSNCSSLTQLDISNWDISKAYTTGMFDGCSVQRQQEPEFTISIVYNSNGGKNAPSTQNGLVYNHEMTITHPNDIPIRDGYTFLGWLYENLGNYEIEQPGTTVTYSELYGDDPITYYAQWERVEDTSVNDINLEITQETSKWPTAAEFPVRVNSGVGEINIRSGPGTDFPVIGRIQEGSSVVVHEIDSSSGTDWGKVGEGWICLDYVTSEAQSSTDYLPLFVGHWGDRVGQRCMMNAEQRGDKLYVALSWSSGASSTTYWEFTCLPVVGDYYVGYQDGICYTLDSSSGTSIRTTHYTNGHGGFQLDRGLIYWIDAVENRGENCVFEKIG